MVVILQLKFLFFLSIKWDASLSFTTCDRLNWMWNPPINCESSDMNLIQPQQSEKLYFLLFDHSLEILKRQINVSKQKRKIQFWLDRCHLYCVNCYAWGGINNAIFNFFQISMLSPLLLFLAILAANGNRKSMSTFHCKSITYSEMWDDGPE